MMWFNLPYRLENEIKIRHAIRKRKEQVTVCGAEEIGVAYLMVASRILVGKSSAATSPPTAMASPPAALISSTTTCAFFSSRLHLCQRCTANISTTVLRVRTDGVTDPSYSLTTTLAPSLAKRRAALLPIPYGSEQPAQDEVIVKPNGPFHTCAAPETTLVGHLGVIS